MQAINDVVVTVDTGVEITCDMRVVTWKIVVVVRTF